MKFSVRLDDAERAIEACLVYEPITRHSEPKPSPTSDWARDRAVTLPPIPDLPISSLQDVVEVVSLPRCEAGVDLMRGILGALRSGSIYSVPVLSRSALEAFAVCAWHWKPSLIPEVRTFRALVDYKSGLGREEERLKNILKVSQHLGDPEATRQHLHETISTSRRRRKAVGRYMDLLLSEHIPSESASRLDRRLPSLTSLVESSLMTPTRSRFWKDTYGELSQIAHPSPPGIATMFPAEDIESQHIQHNTPLGRYLLAVFQAVIAMKHCLSNLATCWGLQDPAEVMDEPMMTLGMMLEDLTDDSELLITSHDA